MGVCLAIFLVGLVGLAIGVMLRSSCRLGLFCCFAGCIGYGVLAEGGSLVFAVFG